MARPQVGSSLAFQAPPREIETLLPPLYEYLLMVHDHIYGLGGGSGSLNNDNISGALSTNHALAISVTAYQHHGDGQHANLNQAAAQADLGGTIASGLASAVSVTSPDGIDAATTQTLANELKGDVNQLVTDLNAAITAYNLAVTKINAITSDLDALKAKLRTANLVAT